jgi:dienelactone hydrolase
MSSKALREDIRNALRLAPAPETVDREVIETHQEQGYTRSLIHYEGDEGDAIPAYLLRPSGPGLFPAVQIHHQHASRRHLGKSEVCGLAGDPRQAFGPALARRGVVVLAADSICFEDRRRNRTGIEPDEANDVDQHYNEMSYRLVQGDTLMRKVLDDAQRGLSILRQDPIVIQEKIGLLGHSYGGTTTLFQAALDERVRFACASGAASSYQMKIAQGIGLEMSLVIPGFARRFDIHDLIRCTAPRRLLIVSASEDDFSVDADQVVEGGREAYERADRKAHLDHFSYEGGHALTWERFEAIIEWIVARCYG